MFFIVGVILVLIVISAFFSGSETALTAISKARIHRLSEKGHRRAKYIVALREQKDKLISSILVGNNLVNILASSLATKVALDIYGDEGIIYSTIVMTFIVVIFAEILPKTYALYHTEKLSLFVTYPIRFLVKVLNPITSVIKCCIDFILGIRNHKISEKEQLILALEELRGSIEIQHREGGVLKQDKDMLDSILDLADSEVGSVMTHRKNLFTINADLPSSEILESIAKSSFTRVPLWQGNSDNIVAILHAKDVLKTTIYSTKEIDEIDFLKISTEPWFIPESRTLREQLFSFKKERNHFAVVVDEYGTVMGVITLEDILEEIVGEIKDEYDKGEVNSYKKHKDGSFVIEGGSSIKDINRDLELSLSEEYGITIAGLLIYNAEKIPERGEKFEFDGFEFVVVEKYRNQLTRIKIKKL